MTSHISSDHLNRRLSMEVYKGFAVVMLVAVLVQVSSASSCACKYACRKIVTSMFSFLILIIFSGCQNGGRMVESGQLFQCHCKPGFIGNKCQIWTPPPPPPPCKIIKLINPFWFIIPTAAGGALPSKPKIWPFFKLLPLYHNYVPVWHKALD